MNPVQEHRLASDQTRDSHNPLHTMTLSIVLRRRLIAAAALLPLGSAIPHTLLGQLADTPSARAEALFASKDYAGAATAFEALTRTNPKQPRYWTRLGTALQFAGRTDDAVSAYRHAIGITTAPVAMYNLA